MWHEWSKGKLTVPVEVGQSAILKAIGYSLATDSLLSDAGNHLGDVDVGSLGAAERHDEGAIRWMQFGEAGLGRLLSDAGQFAQHHCLEGLFGRTAGLALQSARLKLLDVLVALGIAALQQDLLVLQQLGAGRHIADAKRETPILYEVRRNLKEFVIQLFIVAWNLALLCLLSPISQYWFIYNKAVKCRHG